MAIDAKEMEHLVFEVKAHALKYYNDGKGWDYVIEAWEDEDIEEALEEANGDLAAALVAIGEHVALLAENESNQPW